jgi:Protein of unknown function (DUF3617)
MDKFGLALLLVLAGAVPLSAAELPPRKAGLWEMKTTVTSGRTISTQQCVDAKTDEVMQANSATNARRDCSKRDVQKSGSTITIDSVCTTAGKPKTVHTVINGSFDSAYTMVITSDTEGMPARTLNIESKWLGPCAVDQKPGDTIMPNGVKMNVLDMKKGTAPSATPGAPPQQ